MRVVWWALQGKSCRSNWKCCCQCPVFLCELLVLIFWIINRVNFVDFIVHTSLVSISHLTLMRGHNTNPAALRNLIHKRRDFHGFSHYLSRLLIDSKARSREWKKNNFFFYCEKIFFCVYTVKYCHLFLTHLKWEFSEVKQVGEWRRWGKFENLSHFHYTSVMRWCSYGNLKRKPLIGEGNSEFSIRHNFHVSSHESQSHQFLD